ncbi:hypothetical protein MTsPCn5_00560 [Croceitalea sp. MTPC5]|uniref:helix-turn-helix domain-containing protein n=1 Tax=Croceitalea sp. MTPC5 TaxID=3056565 RepID=UPI002B3CEF53|nr:hypothetical protein MTsPCn5_00560 [Croceitalea sp. MTPC5]
MQSEVIQKVNITDYDALGFLTVVAEGLNLNLTEDNREYSVNLTDEIGHGYFKAYDFDHGIAVYEIDCTLKNQINFEFEKAVVQPLLILFNREEEIIISGHEIGKNKVAHLESVMSSEGAKNRQQIALLPNQSTCFFAIIINRKLFEEKITDFLSNMHPTLEHIFRDVNGINQFYAQGYYSLDIAKFIEEFTTTSLTEFMRFVFLEGKIYEILTHFLIQYVDDAKDPKARKILRQQTVERIEEASTIIKDEMDQLGSIISLAKRVGLNQNTLQEGFKQLYKKSVNQYIKEVRMERAKELLESSNLNITEITYQVGINSRSYFSKLFKEQFGISPKHYLQKHRNSNISA